MKNKKILISGYYGFDNFGDDAILHTLLTSIKENCENSQVVVISNNPDKISNLYSVKSIYTFDFKTILAEMRTSNLFISGGGSLLQDVTSFKSLIYYLLLILMAMLNGAKTYIYAQGIGPINSKIGRILTGLILRGVNLVTVRDGKSQDYLKKLGIKSIQTADPVWNIEADDRTDDTEHDLISGKEKVGIQLRSWASLDDKKLDSLAGAVSSKFNSGEYQIILISLQDKQDLEVTRNLEIKLRRRNPDLEIKVISGLSIFQSISLIKNLNYLIAMRYHACLCSMKFAIPTLPVSYDPKVESLAREAQIPYISVVGLDNEEELEGKIGEFLNNSYDYKNRLGNFSVNKQLLSRQNTDLLIKMLDNKGA